jgi:hypothetical protein
MSVDESMTGVTIGVEKYGDGEDDWVYAIEPVAGWDFDLVERTKNILTLMGIDPKHIVSGPQLRELASRVSALADWSTLREEHVKGRVTGQWVHIPRDKRYTALVLDAARLQIPVPLVAKVAIEQYKARLARKEGK